MVKKSDKPMGESIIQEARELFQQSEEGTTNNRENAQEDIRFARLGDQWPEDILKTRKLEARPALTINRLPGFIRQVVNDARQAKPGIKVSPIDNGADKDTAEVISGLIRSIERNGDGAEIAYDTAIDNAVTCGFGFFRIGIDYVNADSFNMEARIERIPNPLMVNWDIASTKFDASDWDYAFISEMLTREEFEKRYPGKAFVDFEHDSAADATSTYWADGDEVRVAEYFRREEKTRKLLLLSNGRAARLDVLAKEFKMAAEQANYDLGGQVKDMELVQQGLMMQGLEVTKERDATFYEVKRRMISGAEVLSEDEWPGSMIPICPVWGEEVFSDGKRYFRSMIRDAKDPQQMFNFWRSATTELVALAPRAPYMLEEGAIPKGRENMWATANTRSHPFLTYTRGFNMPQRQAFAGPPAGALQEALNAVDDMKATTGIYDAGLGARSNETSGVAIQARQKEGDVSNFHFIDNLNRAIRYAGRCLLEIIPAVYSARETVRILGEDQKEKVIKLTMEDGGGIVNPETGERELFNLAIGDYDVEVTAGPSYSTQREETREILIEIMRARPDAFPLMADVLFRHFDFQGSDELAERAAAMLPQAQPNPGPPGAGPMPGQPPGGPGIPPQ
jgi:hypothetical protein